MSRCVEHVMLPGYTQAVALARPRETVAGFLKRAGWRFTLPTILIINGQPVLRSLWRKTRIKNSDKVQFLSRPMGGQRGGGSGKQIIGLVAMVALTALAPFAGAAIAGAIGVTGKLGIALITAGVVAGGSLLISSLVRPKAGGQAKDEREPLYSLNSQGNTARLLEPLPVGYGRLKDYPDYAATPWQEYVGDDQYLNALFCIGCGKYQVEEVLMDDTSLWTSASGYNAAFEGVTIEIYAPGQPVTLFATNVHQAGEVSGQELIKPESPHDGWIGGFIANPSGSQAEALALDFVFPSGLFQTNKKGAMLTQQVPIEVQYRPVNGAGAPTGSWSALLTKTYDLATRNPKRITEKVDVPAGRYEVRVRRTTEPMDSGSGADAIAWAGLRAFLVDDLSVPNVTLMAVRMKATRQLTEYSAKRFAAIWTRILPVWNGSAWVEEPTRSNLWAFLDAATNTDYGARRPLSKIDLSALTSYEAVRSARGDTFDHVFRAQATIPEAFDTILKGFRARHRWAGDVLTFVRDEWKPLPQMLITDREIVRGTFSREYLFNTEDAADAAILEYFDEETWRPAEVQFPEEINPERPTRLRVSGITKRAHAFREAAFFWRQAQYRRCMPTFETEHDGRLLGLGSSINVQSEQPASWGQAGGIISHSGLALMVSPAPTWPSGQAYILLRQPNGKPFGPLRATRGATDADIQLNATDVAAQESTLGVDLADVLARPDGGELASFSFDEGQAWVKRCLVLSGRPAGNRVSLTLVVDRPEVHDDDGLTPPDAPLPPTLGANAAPTVQGLNAIFRQGIAEPQLEASWWPAPSAQRYVAELSYDSGASWSRVYDGDSSSFKAVVEPTSSLLRVAAINERQGPWTQVSVTALPTSINGEFLDPHTVAYDRLDAYIRDAVETSPYERLGITDGSAFVQDVKQRLTRESDQKSEGALLATVTRNETTLTETGRALAEVSTTLRARVEGSEASLASYQVAQAAVDAAQTVSINTAQSTANNANARIDTVEATESFRDSARATREDEIAADLNQTRGDDFSRAVQEMQARESDTREALAVKASVATLSDAYTTLARAFANYDLSVRAEFGSMSAQGLLSITAEATPVGALSRIGLAAKASAYGQSAAAGMFLEAYAAAGGQIRSRIVLAADELLFSNGSGTDVPFQVVSGVVYLKSAAIQDLTVGTSKIANGAVNDIATSSTGTQATATVATNGYQDDQNNWTDWKDIQSHSLVLAAAPSGGVFLSFYVNAEISADGGAAGATGIIQGRVLRDASEIMAPFTILSGAAASTDWRGRYFIDTGANAAATYVYKLQTRCLATSARAPTQGRKYLINERSITTEVRKK